MFSDFMKGTKSAEPITSSGTAIDDNDIEPAATSRRATRQSEYIRTVRAARRSTPVSCRRDF